jgi:hypothetical protein
MQIIIFLAVFLIYRPSYANESPYDKFSTSKNFTNQTIMLWDQADDIQKACESKSREYGNSGFGYPIEACSFRFKNKGNQYICHVITAKKVDMWTVGHEIRHCFQGEFHK